MQFSINFSVKIDKYLTGWCM